MSTLLIMIISIIGLIVVDNVFVVIADNMIDSMIQSNVARNIVKIALCLILFHTMGWVSLLAFVGFGVAHYETARTAIKNSVHNLITLYHSLTHPFIY